MSQQTATRIADPSLSDLVDHLTRFDGPPDQFLLHMLAVQCHVGRAEGGAILRGGAKGEPEVLAVYPASEPNQPTPVWLAHAAEQSKRVGRSSDTVSVPLSAGDEMYDQGAREHLIMIPLRSGDGIRGVAAFVIPQGDPVAVDQSRERLELTVGLLSLYEMRLTLQRRQVDMQRLRRGLEVLASINEQTRFRAAAMGLCNEVASVWQGERVTLGFLKGRYVRAVAMSHTEKLTRKMKIVIDIESAMEECLDQDVEVMHPPAEESTYVSRATGDLAKRHGPTTVCSLPLRQGQKVLGVLVCERPVEKPFNSEEVESLRLVGDLCTARLSDLWEHDKWIGAKAAGAMRKGFATLVGPQYTWVKVAAISVFLATLFLLFARGNDYAEGPFNVEPIESRVVPAPRDGYLDRVWVEQGDGVVADLPLSLQFVETLEQAKVSAALRQGLADQGIELQETSILPEQAGTSWRLLGKDNSGEERAYLISKDDQEEQLLISSVMATLDAQELQLQKSAALSDQVQASIELAVATREQDPANENIKSAELAGINAQIKILDYRIEQSIIVAQISGVVVQGDLKRQQGARVDAGNLLFEVAPLGVFRAEVSLPEHRIVDIDRAHKRALAEGEAIEGELTAVSRPGLHLPVTVERINPVAETTDEGNIFRVRVTFSEGAEISKAQEWLAPGLEGVARIKVGRAHFAWIWTRDIINWVRMKLWW